MAKATRQSNIELLRIIAIMGVVVLHINNPFLGGGLSYVQHGSLNFYALYALESLFMCAVDLFMLISGYFMCNGKSRDLWKPIELILQVILINEALYICQKILSHGSLSWGTIIRNLIPANYFVILYCTVYLVSPFINKLIDSLSDRGFRNFVIVLFLLFSIYPSAVDVLGELQGEAFIGLSTVGAYGSQWGYTFINFAMMYIFGAYLRKCRSKLNEAGSPVLIGALVCCVMILVLWARINDKTGYFAERTAWDYCNPVVIIEAAIIFVLFTRLNIGAVKPVNIMAKACFTTFLIHPALIKYIPIETLVSENTVVMLLKIFVYVAAIYAVSWIVYIVYSAVTGPVFRTLRKRFEIPLIDAGGR